MPTVYFNVPRGFDMLIAALRGDAELRRRFFSEVKFAFYAGAALPQNLWDALEELSLGSVGRALPMVSAWGSTETSPLATDCHFQAKRSGNIGVPIPGTELKLVPSGDKLEVRVRGPNVTPGYWKAPELTAQAFDEEGFYLLPMAVRTWAPRGQTPVLRVPLTHDHLSAISGITPDGRLFLQVRPTSYTAAGVVGFLARVCAFSELSARATRLLERAVAGLLAHRLPAGSETCFPS